VSSRTPEDHAALTGLKRGGCVSVAPRAEYRKYSMSDVYLQLMHSSFILNDIRYPVPYG